MWRINSHKFAVIWIILLLILSGVAGFTMYAGRQVLVLTDPIWQSLHLGDRESIRDLSVDLLRKRYFLKLEQLSIDFSEKEIKRRIEESGAGILFLSPAPSALFLSSGLAAEYPDKTFFVFDLQSSYEMNDGANLIKLSFGKDQLVMSLREICTQLQENERLPENPVILWSGTSYIGKESIEEASEVLDSYLKTGRATLISSLYTVNGMNLNRDSFLFFLPGFGLQNRELLDKLSKRGGRAVLMGKEESMDAWPGTVVSVISIDLHRLIQKALGIVAERPGTVNINIPFKVRLGE